MAKKQCNTSGEEFCAEVLSTLKTAGVDVAKADDFNFYLYLDNEEQASACAEPLRKAGFAVKVDTAAAGSGWLCLASRNMVPTADGLTRIGSQFLELAAKHDGQFDGWEIQPKPMNIDDGLLKRLLAQLGSGEGNETSKEFPALIIARLNDRAQPMDRGELFEDPLQEMLTEAGMGEVSGGGTMLAKTKEIDFCELEICAQDGEQSTVDSIIAMLEKLGAPKGSKLIVDGKEDIPFGKAEGLAVYLNGTDLPDHVYAECDSNHVYEQFNELLGEVGKIHSTWQGPTETALYMYGTSYEEMQKRLAGFMASYPLCQKARVVQVA
jgi:hypothetical protein